MTQLPVAAVGAVILRDDKVLLVKRGQPPSQGMWAIPGGKVEAGETLQAAAEREALEETGVVVEASIPVNVFDFIETQDGTIRFHYVIIDLLCEYVRGKLQPGADATEVKWFSRDAFENEPDVDANTRVFMRRLWQGELKSLAPDSGARA